MMHSPGAKGLGTRTLCGSYARLDEVQRHDDLGPLQGEPEVTCTRCEELIAGHLTAYHVHVEKQRAAILEAWKRYALALGRAQEVARAEGRVLLFDWRAGTDRRAAFYALVELGVYVAASDRLDRRPRPVEAELDAWRVLAAARRSILKRRFPRRRDLDDAAAARAALERLGINWSTGGRESPGRGEEAP